MIAALTTIAGGATATREHSEDRVLAVVRGRVRIMIEVRGGQPAPAWLRASDTIEIPAGTAYTVEAMQETEIYLYAQPACQQPALWGV